MYIVQKQQTKIKLNKLCTGGTGKSVCTLKTSPKQKFIKNTIE